MGLIYTWHIHREQILRGAGVILGMASVMVILSTPHQGEPTYEMGRLFGAAVRNILAGLVVVALGTYLWRRIYWNERARLTQVSPGGALVAGSIALALSLALGGPELAAPIQGGGVESAGP